MEHDIELITQCIQHGKKWYLPLHDINDVMHSHKYKTQISHEHVHKPKHFHWQPIHNNKLDNLMTTCTLFTLKDIANNVLVKNSILQLQFTQVYHHLRHNIQKKKYVAKTISSSWDNI
jgi:hypothetical protein